MMASGGTGYGSVSQDGSRRPAAVVTPLVGPFPVVVLDPGIEVVLELFDRTVDLAPQEPFQGVLHRLDEPLSLPVGPGVTNLGVAVFGTQLPAGLLEEMIGFALEFGAVVGQDSRYALHFVVLELLVQAQEKIGR